MPPNLRCAFAQGWRSIRSRRSFSSSPGSRASKEADRKVTFLGLANKGLSMIGGIALGRLYLKQPGLDLAEEAEEDLKKVEKRVNALKKSMRGRLLFVLS
ncbi:unnamed protein product [Microthlaspi erraticum]|uniref:Uncharacterized protein n=1 Tax=Microthlaspi erraticum TaxID=1685480 RepID=A0A6D2JVA4_9BRAS|nr:unnamed protein product [Microthlaspi erraticum]